MKRPARVARVAAAAALVAGAAAVFHRPADAKVYGLFRNSNGDLLCGGECAMSQQCCEIKILPAG